MFPSPSLLPSCPDDVQAFPLKVKDALFLSTAIQKVVVEHETASKVLAGFVESFDEAEAEAEAAFGFTLSEASDCCPVPAKLTAATLNLYFVPLLSPVITPLVAVAPKVWVACASDPL